MAGRTIAEARNAQCAAAGRGPRPQTAHVATSTAVSSDAAATPVTTPPASSPQPLPSQSIVVNNFSYVLQADNTLSSPSTSLLMSLPPTFTSAAVICTSIMPSSLVMTRPSLSLSTGMCTPCLWISHRSSVKLLLPRTLGPFPSCLARIPSPSTLGLPVTCLWTGLTSAETDPPHPVRDLGGTCVYAIGIGVRGISASREATNIPYRMSV